MATALGIILGTPRVSGQASLLDPAFNPGTGANGIIETVVQQPDGKILVCGNFTVFNGITNSYIARLNADGSVDTNFVSHVSYWVRTIALQPDGKIVIGGFFNYVAGLSRNLIARLNCDGSLDTNFNPGTGASGDLGTAVDGDPDPFIFATALQSDGKILITGNFTNYNGENIYGICRLNTNGLRDTTFKVGPGINWGSWGRSLHIQSNGQIMLTGWFTSYDNQNCNRMALINTNGSVDTNFNPYFGPLTAVYDSLELSDGEYLVVGDTETNTFTQKVALLESDGPFDPSFLGSDDDKTESICQQGNGQILIGGYFSEVDGAPLTSIARLNPDGSLDPSLSAAVDNYIWYVSLQSDGKILISGGFTTIDGVSRNSVARLLPSAAPELVAPAFNSNVFSVSLLTSSNKMYTLQYATSLTTTAWNQAASISGNGATEVLVDTNAADAARFYRVMVQ
jgi:uncharacterized delta-60 repeat protein